MNIVSIHFPSFLLRSCERRARRDDLSSPAGTFPLGDLPRWIAWLNMLGSVAFMLSAIAGFVVPSTGAVLDIPLGNVGTLIGAVCFLVGAALMLPAWRAAVRSFRGAHPAK